MTIDISALSAKELENLISQAKKRKTTLNKRKPLAAVRKKVVALLKAEGYALEELFGGAAPAARAGRPAKAAKSAAPAARKARKPLGKVAPKYRNPANTGETWTGRGKQPRWLAAYTAQGKKLEDFLIK
ncbi:MULTISPECIES: H-NS family nucleoid-associated regulatory protein [Lysobacter]|uniref:DNA-binding protein H-NS n=2 Tax=Lysobacter TaxID=68 RepID=A0A0S2DMA5_LYSEN|nr:MULTISPECIES: H-NS histone family protein [Lysobacter]ALN59545.1 DNA-binding protein H-NS [Lysobacter enzymogenes]QCW27680.1 H-NS histone family protein [Lysobacter enzymogenes]QQQ02381.1 H-NS histone family protein [Lysobacter enzymogenes]ROU07666.1 H-NS histone family protein [Lysobacter enzymogenes]WMT05527.1 H-NS histone family protein [Lysobacter yananisis]